MLGISALLMAFIFDLAVFSGTRRGWKVMDINVEGQRAVASDV